MLSKTVLIAALAAAATASPVASLSSASSGFQPTSTTAPSGFSTSYVNSAPPATSAMTGAPPAGTLLGVPGAKPNVAPPADLVAKLLVAPNVVGRFNTIQEQLNAGLIDLKFDFNPAANPGVTPGAGGQVDLAQRANFPLLTGTGISAAGIFFQPCGLNTPHLHPRATEFLTLVTDSNMLTGFVLENPTTTEFNTTLTQYQGTVFPQGTIHFQQNLDCKPAVAIAGLNSEDPGASSLAQRFIVNIDSEVVDAALGFPKEINADNFAAFKKNIPAPLSQGIEECLIRCHIPY